MDMTKTSNDVGQNLANVTQNRIFEDSHNQQAVTPDCSSSTQRPRQWVHGRSLWPVILQSIIATLAPATVKPVYNNHLMEYFSAF